MNKQVDQRKFVVTFNTVDKLYVVSKIEISLITLKVRNITPYPTMRQFVTKMYTCVKFLLQNGALWDTCSMHCGV